MKTPLFDSLISSESYVIYHWSSSPPLKKYHLWLYIVKKKRFGAAPKRYGIHCKPSFKVENLFFMVFGTLACARMHVYAYACMKYAHVNLKHVCA